MAKTINQVLSGTQAPPVNLIDLNRAPEFSTCTEPMKAALSQIAAKPMWPVFLWGAQGRGKSVASRILMQAYTGKAYATDYSLWVGGEPYKNRLVTCSEAIKNYMDELISGRTAFRKSWCNSPLVVLDDLATRVLTDAQLDALLQIINVRDGKPLVVTCNLKLEEVRDALKDARIPSRLSAGYVVEVTGNDRRLATREKITA